MPNIRGSIGSTKESGDGFAGTYFDVQEGCFEKSVISGSGYTFSYGKQKSLKMLKFDASENGSKKVWQDNASVKSKNFTYKIWNRKF